MDSLHKIKPSREISHKPSIDIPGSTVSVPARYNDRWLNIIGTNPTFTIAGTFQKDDEIEGLFSGTGVLTIVEGSGITLIWPTEYFTNTYPKGAVFGIKFISPTSAALFGKQIPVGL